jgi:glycosyltransferase involved in cell wall biosynthesis
MINISVAIATFNGELYIEEQLRSILEQTYPPIEIVVSDDCSTDSTVDIVQAVAEKSPIPISININDVNKGFADNFLVCASMCKGDWIALSDQDDVWKKDKLKIIVEELILNKERNISLICHSGLVADKNLIVGKVRIPDYKKKIIPRHKSYGFICIPGFTITVRAHVMASINHSDRPRDYFISTEVAPMSHDKWIPLLATTFGEILYLPNALVIYRRHSEALSAKYYPNGIRERVKKALGVGALYYAFQSKVALDCSESTLRCSFSISDSAKSEQLKLTSAKYKYLSRICRLRAELYSSNQIIKCMRLFIFILISGGYIGNAFYAYGPLSLLKDLVHVIRVSYLRWISFLRQCSGKEN